MTALTGFLKAFGQFWVEFLIGDDWKLFATVVVALGASAVLALAGVADAIVVVTGSVLLLVGFCLELVLDLTLQARRTAR